MLTVKKILFPTDFTACCEHAFSQAVLLARHFHAELHLFHAVVRHKQSPVNLFLDFPGEEKEVLEHLHAQPRTIELLRRQADDIPLVQAESYAVAPSMAILEYEDKHDIDLIVMGTHGRSGIDRLLIGSVAEEVVRLSTCPVFTVHASSRLSSEDSFKHILVPFDFSESATTALLYAAELARAYDAHVDVLYVVEHVGIPYISGIEPMGISPDFEAHFKGERDNLEHVVSTHLPDRIPRDVHMVFGRPDRVISEMAQEWQADLIVISSHGRTGLKKMILGSVTEKVVRTATCPVFTVKSFGRSLITGEPNIDTALGMSA